jgi:nucleoside-diphosphate-sugar epimerase
VFAYLKQILVTGATGQIGSELIPELRKKYGRERIVAAGHAKTPNEELLLGPFEVLDVTDKDAIERIVRKYGIDTVYHLAGILSASGERNPALAWRVNMNGLHNVLEISKAQDIDRIFWPSSIAVFGSGAPRRKTPQETSLVPRTIYGVTKVAGELLCNYYFTRYGLDVRSIRYPGIISSETPPGGGTTDYAVEIFYEAVKEKKYTCFVRKDTILPMLYMPDCIKGTLDLMDAPPDQIKIRTSYNMGGLDFTAEELADEIAKRVPDLAVDYKPDFRQQIADSWPISVDDGDARRDWGWKPKFTLATMTQDMLEKLSKRLV